MTNHSSNLREIKSGFRRSVDKLTIALTSLIVLFAFVVLPLIATREAFGSVGKAKKLEEEGQLDKAFSELIEVLQKDPGDTKAKEYIQALAPKVIRYHIEMLNTYENIGDWPNACMESRKLDGVIKIAMSFGASVSEFKVDDQKMLNYCLKAAEKYYQEGKIAFDMGETAKARALFQKVLEYADPYKDTKELIQKCNALH